MEFVGEGSVLLDLLDIRVLQATQQGLHVDQSLQGEVGIRAVNVSKRALDFLHQHTGLRITNRIYLKYINNRWTRELYQYWNLTTRGKRHLIYFWYTEYQHDVTTDTVKISPSFQNLADFQVLVFNF